MEVQETLLGLWLVQHCTRVMYKLENLSNYELSPRKVHFKSLIIRKFFFKKTFDKKMAVFGDI